MQTVLYVSPMTLGDEVQVREIHDNFPIAAMEQGVGVNRIRTFIGSGFYALEITVDAGDFQEQFHKFLGTPEVVDFMNQLRPYVQGLPDPDEGTAHMPLAAPVLDWQRGAAQ